MNSAPALVASLSLLDKLLCCFELHLLLRNGHHAVQWALGALKEMNYIQTLKRGGGAALNGYWLLSHSSFCDVFTISFCSIFYAVFFRPKLPDFKFLEVMRDAVSSLTTL